MNGDIRQLDERDRNAWDGFVAAHPHGHLLQCWEWGDFKAAFGWRPHRYAIVRHGAIVAGAQVLTRRLPVPGISLAYAPKGPLASWDAAGEELVEQLFAGIHAGQRGCGALALTVEPEVYEPSAAPLILRQHGFAPRPHAIQPRSTIMLDVTLPTDEQSARQKPKWRYNIGLARRRGVTVRAAAREGDVDAWYSLATATGQRDGFAVHSLKYYRQAWRRFVPRWGDLLLAEHDGALLAGIFVFQFGRTAWYFYGASGNEGRNLMPNHLLQAEAIEWAARRGATMYDLWGIPDASGENSELAGVQRFKEGFGGEIKRTIGAWDHAYRPYLYAFALRAAAQLSG